MLDELLADGQVVWTGHGAISRTDGWVQLWPGDLILREPSTEQLSPLAQTVADRLSAGGSWRPADLAHDDLSVAAVTDALWELAWAGQATTETFSPVRELVTQGALRRPRTPRPTRRGGLRPLRRPFPPAPGARWSAVPAVRGLDAQPQLQAVSIELGRYGVLTRGSVLTEPLTPRYSEVYPVLAAAEDAGLARRGYFVEGLGAAQFALPGAVDRLRQSSRAPMLLLAACDPANPWGAALPWPANQGQHPTRKAGAVVVLDDGACVCYLERGAHSLITFAEASSAQLRQALALIARAIDERRFDTVTIERINAQPALAAGEFHEILAAADFAMVPQGFRHRAATFR
jgi:ATP-dependent Lhr-like helicase